MRLSIIVPAYNAGATIERCLVSLSSQTLENEYEIVVVDNGSNDNTRFLVKARGVKCISSPNTTVYEARNQAVRVVSGEILAFIDSDCVADPCWLEEGIAQLQNYDVVAGHIQPQPSKRLLLYNYDKFVNRASKGKSGQVVNIAMGNAFIKRCVFEAVGGFDEDLQTAGDSIFSMKARQQGYTVGFAVTSIVYHPVDGWKRRLRGMMREGSGSKLKASYRNDEKKRFLSKVSLRLSNTLFLLRQDLSQVKRAWSKNEINTLVAIGLICVVLFIRVFAYTSILTANLFSGLNRKLARR